MTRLALLLALTALAAPAAAREVTGELTYPARIALPPDAVVILDLRRDGAPAATARMATEGRQVPLPFRLDPTPEGALTLDATVYAANRGIWTLRDAPVPATDPADLGALRLLAATALPDSFIARGNEPGWRLDVTADSLTLSTEDGTRLTLPRPAGDVAAITAEGVEVQATPDLCRDTMTGMPYPLSVTVTHDGRALSGCGGDPASLIEGQWQMRQLGDQPLPDGVFLTFAEGRVSGRAGCNRVTGALAIGGEAITLGPLAATRMACAPEAMQTENAVLQALSRVTGFDFDEGGRLLLTAEGEALLVAER